MDCTHMKLSDMIMKHGSPSSRLEPLFCFTTPMNTNVTLVFGSFGKNFALRIPITLNSYIHTALEYSNMGKMELKLLGLYLIQSNKNWY